VAGSGRSFLPAWPGYAAMLVSAAQKALQPVHQNTAMQGGVVTEIIGGGLAHKNDTVLFNIFVTSYTYTYTCGI